MADNLSVSGTSNPYQTQYYTAQSNDKNTISMTGFFQLLATQLQNQDMSNPMDNSEIMAQMTQMAMVQSMTAMNDAMKNSTAVNTQTYAAGLVGQEVTMAVTGLISPLVILPLRWRAMTGSISLPIWLVWVGCPIPLRTAQRAKMWMTRMM